MLDLFSPSTDVVDGGPITEEERLARIALGLVPGIGPGRIRRLLRTFGDAERVFGASAAQLAGVHRVGEQTAQAILAFTDFSEAEETIARAAEEDVELVTLGEVGYPKALTEIYAPPPVLWVKGRLDQVDDNAVAVVGTRKPTDYGKRAARTLSSDLASRGVSVVSGLAYGIDAEAHKGALDGGGRTIAVLGSGVDVIYPARNKGIVRRIIEEDAGAVISEFPLGAGPDAPHFPQRNRIISGLSRATIVAESGESGGSLITAWLATEQNRDVCAVPVPVFSDLQGTNDLIRKGYARLVTSASDVLREWGEVEKPVSVELDLSDLTKEERRLYDALTSEPQSLDAICEHTGMDASDALVRLLSLEFKGLVRQMAGKQFFRA